MNFDLTDDQRSIQRTARDFLAARYKPEEIRRLAYETERGFTDEGWADICELGWPALLVDEEHGGLGLGVVELAVVQEELGAALAPSPFLSTVAAAALIADAGSDEQRARWLPGLAAGRGARHGGVAARRRRLDRRARRRRRRRGRGARRRRLGAGRGRDRGAGRRRSTRRGGCGASRADGALDPLPGDGARAARRHRRRAGRRVGRRRPAHAWRWRSTTPRSASSSAARSAPTRPSRTPARRCCSRSRARARSSSTPRGRSTTSPSPARWPPRWPRPTPPTRAGACRPPPLQVHGGIGFTWEHDLHLWLKRGKANAYLWGDAREHRARVADLIGL